MGEGRRVIDTEQAATRRFTVLFAGLRCAGSERYTIERALKRVPGVVDAYVNPVTELAYIDYNPATFCRGQPKAEGRFHLGTEGNRE